MRDLLLSNCLCRSRTVGSGAKEEQRMVERDENLKPMDSLEAPSKSHKIKTVPVSQVLPELEALDLLGGLVVVGVQAVTISQVLRGTMLARMMWF
jgi:hypothetical protein